jgi:hypothetical protein
MQESLGKSFGHIPFDGNSTVGSLERKIKNQNKYLN